MSEIVVVVSAGPWQAVPTHIRRAVERIRTFGRKTIDTTVSAVLRKDWTPSNEVIAVNEAEPPGLTGACRARRIPRSSGSHHQASGQSVFHLVDERDGVLELVAEERAIGVVEVESERLVQRSASKARLTDSDGKFREIQKRSESFYRTTLRVFGQAIGQKPDGARIVTMRVAQPSSVFDHTG